MLRKRVLKDHLSHHFLKDQNMIWDVLRGPTAVSEDPTVGDIKKRIPQPRVPVSCYRPSCLGRG